MLLESNIMTAHEETPVPDFTVVGFEEKLPELKMENLETYSVTREDEKPFNFENIHALRLSACVEANYNSSTNKLCFSALGLGNFCIKLPADFVPNGQIKVCLKTCGISLVPTGLKATVYMQGVAILTKKIFGSCVE